MRFQLRVRSGRNKGRVFELPEGETVIGRSLEEEISLFDQLSSRRHASVTVAGHGVTVSDLGSRNGTTLNGEPLLKPGTLQPGDCIAIGDTELVLEDLANADRDTEVAIPELEPSVASSASRSEASRVASQLNASEVDLSRRPDANRRRLAALYGIGRALAGSLEPPEVVETTLEGCVEALEAHAGWLFLREPHGDAWREVRRVERGSDLPVDPSLIADVQASARNGEATAMEIASGGSILAAPLLGGTQPVGAIVVACRRAGADPSGDLEFLTEAGRLAALTLEGARTHARTRETARELSRLLNGGSRIVGQDAALLDAVSLADRAAEGDSAVLIQGETGTGKELLARRIHERSTRRRDSFVAINCAAVAPSLIEAELFGHERGAFTGAHRRRAGLFESASGGTLFLDEVGELPLSMQPKLLRVLQEGELTRVGGSDLVSVDVRVVSATNRSLDDPESFRADLYYRLAVVTLCLPPLRERRADIPELAQHLLEHVANRLGRRQATLSDAALEALAAQPWPGNVRELANAIERALVLAPAGAELGAQWFDAVDSPGVAALPQAQARAEAAPGAPPVSLRELERRHIAAVLKHTDGHRTNAAGILGISLPTLRKRIRDLGLD